MAKILKNLLLLTLPGLLFLIIVLELVFRFIIPASQQAFYSYDPDDQIVHLDMEGPREGMAAWGRLGEHRARWRVNNYGWNSAVDYVSFDRQERPVISIIGDSFVEAFQANVENNIAAELKKLVEDEYDVYSFGLGGIPLSQYLQLSRYIDRHFQPEVMIFVVAHNDFTESIENNSSNGNIFLQLNCEEGEAKELPIVPFHPNYKKRLVFKSAIMRYFHYNMPIPSFKGLFGGHRKKDVFNANIDVSLALSMKESVRTATEYITATVRAENPDKELIFLMDGARTDIYRGTLEDSNVLWLHEILKEACEKSECTFIDLSEVFDRRYKADSVMFNTTVDLHWNDYGHRVVAEEVYEKLKEMGVVGE